MHGALFLRYPEVQRIIQPSQLKGFAYSQRTPVKGMKRSQNTGDEKRGATGKAERRIAQQM